MKDVIFMSSRDHPGFLNTWIQIARDLGLTSQYDNYLILPMFDLGYMQPIAQEATDLYMENLQTHAVRRLTTDGDQGWVTPEFTWTPDNGELFWTENRLPPGLTVPLPLNLALQAQNTVNYILHPYLNPKNLSLRQRHQHGAAGAAADADHDLPGLVRPAGELHVQAAPRASRPRHQGDVWLNGKRILTRTGRNLRQVKITRPVEQSFNIRIRTVQSNGRKTTQKHSYTGMGCYAGA